MKRILCMILFLLMLLSLGSCANTKEEPSNTEGGTGQAATDAETEKDFFPDVEKTDYKGETFRMIGWQSANSWYYSESYSGDASDGQSIRNDFSNLF